MSNAIESLQRQINELRALVNKAYRMETGMSEYYLDVARGNVTGWSALNKFGRNPDIDATTEAVWDGGGSWVAPTAARVHNIASSSANDDGDPAGTGAQTIRIYGLNGSYVETTEDITMNGTSNVATANSYVIIYRMYVLTAGSGLSNAGNITATAQTDATVTAQITTGNNQTLMAIWQVPASKSAYITQYYVSANGTVAGSIDIKVFVKPFGGVYQLKHVQGMTTGASVAPWTYAFNPPLKLEEKSVIAIYATTTANNMDVSAGFDGIYGA